MASRAGAPSGPNFGDVPQSAPVSLPTWRGKPVIASFAIPDNDGNAEPKWYGAVAGSPYVVNRRFTPIFFRRWNVARDHIRGAPLSVRILYSATWRLLANLPPPEPAKEPKNRKGWAQLSESTKRGYRGPLRKLGLTTEAQFAEFYATAPDLSVLRRHVKPSFMTPAGPMRFGRGSGTWLVTWQR